MKSGLTLSELAAEIWRQKDKKEDYIVNTPHLRMESSGGDMLLRVLDEDESDRIEPLDIGPNAHIRLPHIFPYRSSIMKKCKQRTRNC